MSDNIKEKVENALDEIRPFLQRDRVTYHYLKLMLIQLLLDLKEHALLVVLTK